MNDTKSIMVLFLGLAEISTLTLLVEITKSFDLQEQELSCVNEQKMNHYLGNRWKQNQAYSLLRKQTVQTENSMTQQKPKTNLGLTYTH